MTVDVPLEDLEASAPFAWAKARQAYPAVPMYLRRRREFACELWTVEFHAPSDPPVKLGISLGISHLFSAAHRRAHINGAFAVNRTPLLEHLASAFLGRKCPAPSRHR